MNALRRSWNSMQRSLGWKSIGFSSAVGLGSSPMMQGSANYKAAGVDYDVLDEGKRMAIAKALATSPLLGARGGQALDASRGEPAFVFDFDGRTFAFVMEGLGTKSIIARQMLERHGVNRFADVAYDTVAAILND